jgi:hypothetical protein
MRYTTVGAILLLVLLVALFAADAQHAGKIPRVGILLPYSSSEPSPAGQEVFQQALYDLGYVEGQTIAFERRWAEQQFARLPT